MSKLYQNPPILEALCEFRFSAGTQWDLVIPGLIYDQVKDLFEERRRAAGVALHFSAMDSEAQLRAEEKVQFLHKNQPFIMQIAPYLLSVNHLRPYSSWQAFQPIIRKAYTAYSNVTLPTGIEQIGVRYINGIEIPSSRLDIEDYFQVFPTLGPSLPQEFGAFMVGVQIPYNNARDSLRLQLASAHTDDPDTARITLDLEYVSQTFDNLSIDHVFEWLEEAHGRIEEVFEASLTPMARQLFGE